MEPQEQTPVIPRVLKRSSDSNGRSADLDASSTAKKEPQQIPAMGEENVDSNTHNDTLHNYVALEDDGYGSAVSLSPPTDRTVVNALNVSGDQNSTFCTKGDYFNVGELKIYGNIGTLNFLPGGALKLSSPNSESSQLQTIVKEQLVSEVCNAQDSVEGGVDRRAVKHPVRRELKYESPETASCDGKHVWKIANFSQHKQDVLHGKEVDTTGLEAFDECVHEDDNEIKLLQDQQDMMDARLKRLEHGGLFIPGNRGQHSVEQTDRMARGSEGVSNARMVSVENQLGMHAVRIADLEYEIQVHETANYEGELLWKIKDFTRRKRDADSGKTSSLYSQPFYTSRYGYKMCARIYLNGDGMGKGTHVSLFFVVMRGDNDELLPWPFRQKFTLMLLDQDTGRHHISDSFRPEPNSSSFQRPTTEMNIASGCPLHIDHKVLEDSTYLKDDVISVKVVVDTRDISWNLGLLPVLQWIVQQFSKKLRKC